MTKIIISDPTEGVSNDDSDTWQDYWSVDILEKTPPWEDGHALVANFNVAEEALPDLDDPEDAAAFFEETAEGIRAVGEAVEDFEEDNGGDETEAGPDAGDEGDQEAE